MFDIIKLISRQFIKKCEINWRLYNGLMKSYKMKSKFKQAQYCIRTDQIDLNSQVLHYNLNHTLTRDVT